MSQSQPLDVPDPASLDGLDQMFSAEGEASPGSRIVSENGTIGDTTSHGVKVHTRELPSDLFTRGFDDVDEIANEFMAQAADPGKQVQSISTFDYGQMRASSTRNRLPAMKPGPVATRQIRADELEAVEPKPEGKLEISNLISEEDKVSRTELVGLLESFIKILQPGGEISLAKAQQMMMTGQHEVQEIRVEDKTQELEEMRRLVIEAQETIIKLLTDRVEDRARIATLETELRLLPDLQDQADRAMNVAFKTEEFRSELHKVKFELERYRLQTVRGQSHQGPKYWITRVRRWFLKAQGLKLRNYADDATRKLDPQ